MRDAHSFEARMPFALFKWAGGKRALVPDLLKLAPTKFKHYYEPFVGGGAMYFSIRPHAASLSDRNSELITCYKQVRNAVDEVIEELERMPNNEFEYYRVRKQMPRLAPKKAARFLYLTTLSFNGLYRLNRNGQFNVPYGRKTYLDPCDAERLLDASDALQRAKLRCCDFELALRDAQRGDFVYVDPPYTVAHGNNGFLKYNAKIFSWKDQERLARLMLRLANRGCKVMVSNADHAAIRELYKDFDLHLLKRASVMAADPSHRANTTECVFTSY